MIVKSGTLTYSGQHQEIWIDCNHSLGSHLRQPCDVYLWYEPLPAQSKRAQSLGLSDYEFNCIACYRKRVVQNRTEQVNPYLRCRDAQMLWRRNDRQAIKIRRIIRINMLIWLLWSPCYKWVIRRDVWWRLLINKTSRCQKDDPYGNAHLGWAISSGPLQS